MKSLINLQKSVYKIVYKCYTSFTILKRERPKEVFKMVKVSTKEQAWTVANEIFPTDYAKDNKSSANAGYPIYRSIEDGNYSWISDTGSRLELNIFNESGDAIEVTTILIEEPAAEDTIALSRTLVEDLEESIKAKLSTVNAARVVLVRSLAKLDHNDPSEWEQVREILGILKYNGMARRELDDLLTRLTKEVNGHA